jgi:alpha-L-arabinofuranosidase
MRSLLVVFALMVLVITAPMMAAQKVELSIDASKTGAKIDRNIFGQFAEHLGHGIYEGIWVGSDSKIPNTRGIRNDVVGALRAIKVPNVRWPGGCFADEYHWRKGIGTQRSVTLNPNWGGVTESNTFGTDEFMDFVDQIGAEAYVFINVGSGTPQEAAEWLEYMTAAAPTTLAKERAANGHPTPYKVALLGIGNESWDCGGNMTPDYYVSQMKIYSRFVRNFNPEQQRQAPDAENRRRPWRRRPAMDRLDGNRHEGLSATHVELGHQRSFHAQLHGGALAAFLGVGGFWRS